LLAIQATFAKRQLYVQQISRKPLYALLGGILRVTILTGSLHEPFMWQLLTLMGRGS